MATSRWGIAASLRRRGQDDLRWEEAPGIDTCSTQFDNDRMGFGYNVCAPSRLAFVIVFLLFFPSSPILPPSPSQKTAEARVKDEDTDEAAFDAVDKVDARSDDEVDKEIFSICLRGALKVLLAR